MKERTAKFLRGFVSVACAVATALGGWAVGFILLPESAAWGWGAAGCVAALACILCLNLVFMSKDKKRFADMSARQAYDYSVKMQQEIEKSLYHDFTILLLYTPNTQSIHATVPATQTRFGAMASSCLPHRLSAPAYR